jgi:hypothetical protein
MVFGEGVEKLKGERLLSSAFRFQLSRASDVLAAFGAEDGLGVFLDLFRGFKVAVVDPGVFVLAVASMVSAADVGPGGVDAAEMVVAQVLTLAVLEEIPGAVLGEDGGPFVEQEPPHEVEILPAVGRLDGEGVVATALARAVTTETFARLEILPMWFA